jgi:hypothetical protein
VSDVWHSQTPVSREFYCRVVDLQSAEQQKARLRSKRALYKTELLAAILTNAQ